MNTIRFTARPFENSLHGNGIHFDWESRQCVREKLEGAAARARDSWEVVQALGGPWEDSPPPVND